MRAIPLKIITFFVVSIIPLAGQVVLSEIMFNLEGSDSPNEYVEIYNLSTQDTIDLAEWKIRDKYSLDDLVDAGMGLHLLPRTFALIMEGDYDISTGIYTTLIPESALIIKVDDNSIGNGLGNSADSLFLINVDGDTVDFHGWEGITAPGYSLERIRLDKPSITDNWSTSIDSLGTPGFLNSVLLPEIDAALDSSSISHSPQFPTPSDEINLSFTILNLGLASISGNVDVVEDDWTLASTEFFNLHDNDSTLVQIILPPLQSGIHVIDIRIVVDDDVNVENNTALYTIIIQYSDKVLIINEFLYAPDPGIPEFIEFVNISERIIDLTGWGFSDSDTGSVRFFPGESIPSGGYWISSKDSTLLPFLQLDGVLLVSESGFPTLNNSGDAIYLFDPTGTVADSVVYTSAWGGGDGRSLEKLNPDMQSDIRSNWGTCVSLQKMTPGTKNSIFLESLPTSGVIVLDPNPFSPDGDGFDDHLRISYNLPFSQASITVLIFDSRGREVRTLSNNLATGSQGILLWDGFTNQNKRARIGRYILKIIAVEIGSNRTAEWVQTAVLAKHLR